VDKKQQGEEEDDMKKRTKEKEVKQAIEYEASGASGQETGLCASEQKKYDLAEKSLRAFIEAAWPVVEPGRQFAGNWHIDSICSHLEAVTRGEITRLVINVPYRTSKSTIVSVMWPVWVWLQDPTKRFLTGSHKDALSVRDCLKSRRIISSEWFKTGWGDRFRFHPGPEPEDQV
jgi:hypothetical protein